MASHKDRYDRCCTVHTIFEEDKEMIMIGIQIYNRDYSFKEKVKKDGSIIQNCADLVADIVAVNKDLIIYKPKIEKGSPTREGPYIWNFLNKDIIFKNGITSPFDTNITWPNKQYEDFRDENSSGTIELPQ